MKEVIHVKNAGLIFTEEYDIIREWDGNGNIVTQMLVNVKRYRSK